MNYIFLGKIVNTHGIKGEIRIISDFKYKDQIFNPNQYIYIGKNKEQLKIVTYRKHKNYDMITLEGLNDINLVLKYKGLSVYTLKENITGILNEDLIGCEVISNNQKIGIVTEIISSKAHEIIVLNNNNMIPYIKEFIEKIDLESKKIYINEIEGLIHEN